MCRFGYKAAFYGLFALASAQAASLGLLPPKPLHTVPPAYTPEARRAGTQGTVLLFVKVTEQGHAERVDILSRLDHGLDRQAVDAVSQWRFEPGRVDGQAVPAWTTVRVDFRLAGRWFDADQEADRTQFAWALAQPVPDWSAIEHLAKKRFAPAQHRWGQALELGLRGRAGNLPAARAEYEAAAAQHYAPALFELGRLDWATVPATALPLLVDASVMGSIDAQRFLAERFAAGDGVEQDRERAQRQYRLCATGGDSTCRLRLASMLLENGSPRARLQAIAWQELAGVETQALPDSERAMVDAFKRQFEQTALARR